MRVAAGVILIIASVINLFASLGYLGAGALSVGSNQVEHAMERDLKNRHGELTTRDREQLERFQNGTAKLRKSGGPILFFGVFLLVTVGTSFAGAIFLFMQKHAGFIATAAVLAILAEIGGSLATRFGVTNVFGLLGGLFALIAARQIADTGRARPAENAIA